MKHEVLLIGWGVRRFKDELLLNDIYEIFWVEFDLYTIMNIPLDKFTTIDFTIL
jgi:hypothetical protein